MNETVVKTTLRLVDGVYNNTEFENKDDGKAYFEQLRANLPGIAATADGSKVINKFTVLAKTATTEPTFRDMVKIIWRMVKTISGTPMFRLALLFLGVGAMCASLTSAAQSACLPTWVTNLEPWMGKQLTIGGKGVAGEGEGSVHDRVQRFFSTPYLHDFD